MVCPLHLYYYKLKFENVTFSLSCPLFSSDSCLDFIFIPYFYLRIVTKWKYNFIYVGPTNVGHLFDHLLCSIFQSTVTHMNYLCFEDLCIFDMYLILHIWILSNAIYNSALCIFIKGAIAAPCSAQHMHGFNIPYHCSKSELYPGRI